VSLFESIRRFLSPTREEVLEERGLPDYFKDEPKPTPAIPLRYKCWRCKTVYRRLKAKRRDFKCQCGIELFPLTGELTTCAECNLDFPFEILGSCPRCDFREQEGKRERAEMVGVKPPIVPGQFANDLVPEPEPLSDDELWRKWNQ